jgi:hypothetical protein
MPGDPREKSMAADIPAYSPLPKERAENDSRETANRSQITSCAECAECAGKAGRQENISIQKSPKANGFAWEIFISTAEQH